MVKQSLNLSFSKGIYKAKAVRAAIKAYRGWADFCLVDNKKEIKVVFKKIDPEVADVIGLEFSNYVLSLMRE